MKNDLLINKKKNNFYFYFHLIVAILYFIFFLLFFARNTENIEGSTFRKGGYLFLTHSILNLIITGLIFKKIRWIYILLNVLGGLVVISLMYFIVKLLSNYTNIFYVNFMLVIYSVIFLFMSFYLYYLNKIVEKTNNNEIEELGKPQ